MPSFVRSIQNASEVYIATILKFICDPNIATNVVTYEFVNCKSLACFVMEKISCIIIINYHLPHA